MKPSDEIYLLDVSGIPILQQLQWEEALLRVDHRNWCLINHGSPPAIVMGISCDYHSLVHHEKVKREPLPVIRRFSGGGTVVVDEETIFVTLIINKASLPISPFPKSILKWTEAFYSLPFDGYPFSLQENDYVMGDKKFGGNAQSIVKERWLHHTSMIYNFCPTKMAYLQLPIRAPAYRQQRTHDDFLCRLKDYFASIACVADRIKAALNHYFDVKTVGVEEMTRVAALPHRKATKEIW